MSENRRIFFCIFDMVCILAALAFSSWLMLPPTLDIFADYTGASTFTLFTFFLSFYMLDCYAIGKEDFRDSVVRVIVAVIIGIVGTGFIFYTFEHWRFPRLMVVVQISVTLALTLGWRFLYHKFSTHFDTEERIVLLGSTMAGRARRFLTESQPNTKIIGHTGPQKTSTDEEEPDEDAGPWLGEAAKTLSVCKANKATQILVLDQTLLEPALVRKLLRAKLGGLKVNYMRTLYEHSAQRLPIDFIEDKWLLLEEGFELSTHNSMRRFKRACDVGFSLLLLLFASPVLLVVCGLVALESRGGAIYTQRRVGQHLREFTLYKIRSMRFDAEKDGAVWAQAKDPRVTRIGRFIRKTRIDELPQLVNVLKGDMSLIGPRPERMDFVKELLEQLPYYNLRHSMKPGITGWAQVSYPYGASLEDSRYKLEYDLYYIKNLTLLLEAKIILKTIGVVLFPKGAR